MFLKNRPAKIRERFEYRMLLVFKALKGSDTFNFLFRA